MRSSLPHDDARRPPPHADELLAAGRWDEAASAYRSILASRPDHADAWFNLGYVLRRLGHFEQALESYAAALRFRIRQPEVAHVNRAAILADHLHRDDEAASELQAALALAPDHPPALLNLGNLHEERGERAAAIDCYRRLLASERADATAHALDATARLLQLEPPADRHDPLLDRARAAASARSGNDGPARATLLFSLGRAYDALGEVDEAFAAFTAGKQLAHRGHRPYDAARDRLRTQALIASTSGSEPVCASAMPSPEPLFICGMFRSGSTLLEQVLAAHPAVAAAGELDLLPRLVAGPLAPFPALLATLDAARCATLAADYHAGLRAKLPDRGEGRRYATDKRPDNYLLIGLVKRLFPRAKILHTQRHPLDNALSIHMQHLNPRVFDYAGSLAGIGHHYGEYRRLMAHWKTLYPGDILDFDYDAFVAAPEATLRPLLAFLGLPWHPGCLDFHQLRNTVKTASYWQVRRPLYKEACGRWRRYRDHLDPLLAALEAQGVAIPNAP